MAAMGRNWTSTTAKSSGGNRCETVIWLHNPNVTSRSISTLGQPDVAAPFRSNARYQIQSVRTRFLGAATMTGEAHVPHHMPLDFSGAQWQDLPPFTPTGHWAATHY